MADDELLNAKIEQRHEEAILDRLERLGDGQKTIFNEQHKARMRGLVVALVGLLVAGLLGWYVNEQRVTLDQFQAQRTEARIAACQQDRVRIRQHNDLADSVQHILDITNVSNASRTPEQMAAAERFFADARAAIDKARVADRVCTPDAIAAYYSTTQPGG